MAGASEIQKSNLSELRVDGGMAANDFFLELQADCLGLPVIRPRFIETTVLGAAYLAGLEAGMWKDLKELEPLWEADRTFEPSRNSSRMRDAYEGWKKAVALTREWARNAS